MIEPSGFSTQRLFGQGQVPRSSFPPVPSVVVYRLTTWLSLKRVIVIPFLSTEYRNGRAGRTSPNMGHAMGSTAVSLGLAGVTLTLGDCGAYCAAAAGTSARLAVATPAATNRIFRFIVAFLACLTP